MSNDTITDNVITDITDEITQGQPVPEPEPADDGPQDGRDDSREAAKYRRRLRDAEAERDALKGRLEAIQRQHVEHLAQSVGRIRPGALWASGVTLDMLLDGNGNVDAAKVEQACEEASALLGLARVPKPDFSAGHAPDELYPSRYNFEEAFRPNQP